MSAQKEPVGGGLHLIKLCVGIESLADLRAWRAARAKATGEAVARHWTRMTPKRRDELLDGGSLFWVIKGVVRCRQRILDLRAVSRDDGAPATEIVLSGDIVAVEPQPRRPFQGWRYLTAADAPADVAGAARRGKADALPAEIDAALSEFGVR